MTRRVCVVDAVRRLVRTYLDRCLAHGPLRLKQLQLVEEKVIAELGLEHFHETGQGRSLLAFILLDPEIQQAGRAPSVH